MNPKQFALLAALVIATGAAGLIVHQRGHDSWQSASRGIGQKWLPDLAVNDVAHIGIKAGAGELNLVKRDQLWRVRERGDYPADFTAISELLMKLADLKIAQTEEIGASQLGRFELLPPGAGTNTATVVELSDAGGKRLASLWLGKRHMSRSGGEGWPDGRYVKAGEASNVAVISDPLDRVQTGAAAWLNKDFLRIEKPRSIAVQFPAATNSWKLTRASETNDWLLADAQAGETPDPAKISGVTSLFNPASFSDVAPLTTSNTPAATTLTVETFDGFIYVARISHPESGNYSVSFSISAPQAADRVPARDEKPEDKARLDQESRERQTRLNEKLQRELAYARWVFQFPAYVVDPILKSRGELLVEGKNEEPAKVEK